MAVFSIISKNPDVNELLEYISIIALASKASLSLLGSNTVLRADDCVPRSSATDGGLCVDSA